MYLDRTTGNARDGLKAVPYEWAATYVAHGLQAVWKLLPSICPAQGALGRLSRFASS